MDKKTFVVIIVIVILTFSLTMAIEHYRPPSTATVSFDDFPLELGDWKGQREEVSEDVLALLNPKDIFAASFTNGDGIRIHLFFDFFSSDAGFGGPHSPRNCLPGSGWTIERSNERTIVINKDAVETGRFSLRYRETRQVMDFWYVTSYGATGSDYLFKFYHMLSSLTFQPKDVGFVRFVTNQDERSLRALDEFQQLFTPEIYRRMQFGR